MKKLFTLLVAIGTMSVVFAQGHNGSYQNNRRPDNRYNNEAYRNKQQRNTYSSNGHYNDRYVVAPPAHNRYKGYYNVPQRRSVFSIITGGSHNRGFERHRKW